MANKAAIKIFYEQRYIFTAINSQRLSPFHCINNSADSDVFLIHMFPCRGTVNCEMSNCYLLTANQLIQIILPVAFSQMWDEDEKKKVLL